MPVITLKNDESDEDFSTDESLEFAIEDDEELSDVEELLHDTTTLYEGIIREEVCATHKHVLWTIDYQPLQEKTCVMGSPFFDIGSQSYSLELERCDDNINFSLYRKGPPVYGNTEWWSGLELSDGSCNYVITNGKLGLLDASELWTHVRQLNSFSLVNIERNHIDADGHITFSFWVSVEQEPIGAEAFIYDAAKMTAQSDGNIQEEVCCSHKYVLWTIDYEPLQEENCLLESPPFSIENQNYSLKLVRCDDHIISKLYRLGPSVEKNVRWCAGVKRGSGSYYHKIKSGILDLKTECKSWIDVLLLDEFQLSSLRRNHIAADGQITFFFQLNMGQTLTRAYPCTHSAAEMTLPGDGSIQEMCSYHRPVLWTVDYELLREEDRVMASRSFSIGNQCYLLELKRSYYNVDFTLYRMGSSVDMNVRWWAGLERGDGSYQPKIKNGIFNLKTKCELWTVGTLLDSFSLSDLERSDISTDGHITFFFQMNVEQALTEEESFTHGAAQIIVRGEGSIREEVCSAHMHVLWTVDYEPLRKEGREMGSSSFNVGNQSYFLELKRTHFGINFSLYRMGPSVNESIRWWAGLKRNDGICYHRIENGELDLQDNCELWMFVRHLVWCSSSELERNNFETDGRITFFFRMNVEKTLTKAEKCNHGASEMTARGEGSLREEVCSSHKQMLWTVDYEPLPGEDCVKRSPPFSIENQCYFLELKRSSCDIHFDLYRIGPSVERNLQWCAGLKHGDGSYHHNNTMNGMLDLKTECNSWMHVLSLNKFQPSELEKNIVTDERLTFFFQTNVERSSIGAESSTHGVAEMTARDEGNIREEVCSSHKYLLWTVDYEPLREEGRVMVSPAFNFGNQSYVLDLRSSGKDIKFELYRMGPCVDRSVRWWAGLKFRDGSCHHVIKNERLNLENECELWTIVGQLDQFSSSDLKKNYLTPEGCLTFFFLMSLEITPAGTGMCKHGAAEMTVRGEGNIREEMCSSHKHVYWSVDYKLLRVTGRVIGSPSFVIGNQSYVLHLETFHDGTKLKLYRMGPCELAESWCVGLKYGKKCYTERLETRHLDLEEECGLWTYVSSLDWFSSAELERGRANSDDHVTFFYFMNGTLTEAETNIKGTSARGVGSIAEDVWPSYKLVKWDVDYQPGPVGVPSPDFRIRSQKCFLELSYCDENIKLELYRLGQPVYYSFLWWAVVNDGMFLNYGSKCGKLDFKEESCELWRHGEWLLSFEEKKRRMHFTVEFLVSLEPAPADGQTMKHLPEEEIVFRIDSKEFRIHRAILRIRIPVFERMFFHDCIENRTGVVDITDVEPEIFKFFLNFIHSGDPQEVKSRNAYKLYVVADKYLFQDLKSVCLQFMKDSLSVNTIFDVARLAYHHNEHDLLREATNFFSRNKNDIYIYRDSAWRNFCRSEPDIADILVPSCPQENT